MKSPILILTLMSSMAIAQAPVEPSVEDATGAGNGGVFTLSRVYHAVHELSRDIDRIRAAHSGLFQITGGEIRAAMANGELAIELTERTLRERTTSGRPGSIRDALYFNKNIRRSEIRRYQVQTESPEDKHFILFNRAAIQAQLDHGRSIKEILAHELWGAFGHPDPNYVSTALFFELLSELNANAERPRTRRALLFGMVPIIAPSSCFSQEPRRLIHELVPGTGLAGYVEIEVLMGSEYRCDPNDDRPFIIYRLVSNGMLYGARLAQIETYLE